MAKELGELIRWDVEQLQQKRAEKLRDWRLNIEPKHKGNTGLFKRTILYIYGQIASTIPTVHEALCAHVTTYWWIVELQLVI